MHFPISQHSFWTWGNKREKTPKNQRPSGCYKPGRQKYPLAACDRSLQPRLLPAPHTEEPTPPGSHPGCSSPIHCRGAILPCLPAAVERVEQLHPPGTSHCGPSCESREQAGAWLGLQLSRTAGSGQSSSTAVLPPATDSPSPPIRSHILVENHHGGSSATKSDSVLGWERLLPQTRLLEVYLCFGYTGKNTSCNRSAGSESGCPCLGG